LIKLKRALGYPKRNFGLKDLAFSKIIGNLSEFK